VTELQIFVLTKGRSGYEETGIPLAQRETLVRSGGQWKGDKVVVMTDDIKLRSLMACECSCVFRQMVDTNKAVRFFRKLFLIGSTLNRADFRAVEDALT
jgi:hypothetical protein